MSIAVEVGIHGALVVRKLYSHNSLYSTPPSTSLGTNGFLIGSHTESHIGFSAETNKTGLPIIIVCGFKRSLMATLKTFAALT